MAKYLLQIEVDEELLKAIAECDNTDAAIWQEFGWLSGSGINLEEVKKIETNIEIKIL